MYLGPLYSLGSQAAPILVYYNRTISLIYRSGSPFPLYSVRPKFLLLYIPPIGRRR